MRVDIGDKLVVPGQGVGTVEGVERQAVGGDTVQLYRIGFEGSRARLWVPADRLAAHGLRPVMAEEALVDIEQVIRSAEAPVKRENWNRRRHRYTAMLMSNDPQELALMLGELAAVRRRQRLSFGERVLFEKVAALLKSEIASALGIDEDQAQELLDQMVQGGALA